MTLFRKTYAEINLDHLSHNVRWLLSHSQSSFFCPMVKANAYGHGDVQVALHLEAMGVSALGVCLVEEGLRLRAAGVKAPILVFRGFDEAAVDPILEFDLTPVITDLSQIEHLGKSKVKEPKQIHIKFDTGMNRLGLKPAMLPQLESVLSRFSHLSVKGLLTHLATGEDAESPAGFSAVQIQQILELKKSPLFSEAQLHCLNSAGFLSLLKAQGIQPSSDRAIPEKVPNQLWNKDLLKLGLRPGLSIYGYSPITEYKNELKPVMKLKAQISQLNWIEIGESVSYNRTWKAARRTLVGVVPIGYADGYSRLLSNRSEVLVKGRRVRQIGNICMDYLMVDLTELSNENGLEQAEVVLFGEIHKDDVFVEKLAGLAQTIPWEILTSVGERVPRVYHKSSFEKPRIVREIL